MPRIAKVHIATIAQHIHVISGLKVLIDSDLAILYGVPTKALIQTVKRNKQRFPSDFMFQLSDKQAAILRSQFVTSSYGGRRYRPYAFTEQGVAMLSSVLRSEMAIRVNIAIMRAFVQVRQTVGDHRLLRRLLRRLKFRVDLHDKEISAIVEFMRRLMEPSPGAQRRIGF